MILKNSPIFTKKRQVQALLQGNRLEEARVLLTEICRLDERDVESWFLLGTLYGMTGKAREAEAALRRTVTLAPNHALAHYNLGIALRDQDKLEEAAKSLYTATRIKTDYIQAYNSLGFVFLDLRQSDLAIRVFEQVVRLQPQAQEAHANLGSALRDAGRLEEAAACYRRAIQLKPDGACFYNGLGGILYRQGKIEEAIDSDRQALRLQPNEPGSHSDLLFALQYSSQPDPAGSLAAHRDWAARHGGHKNPPIDTYRNIPDSARRLRVGYVSRDFREHSVAYFFEPLLAQHDAAVVETFCYADVKHADATTVRLKSLAHHWRMVSHLPHAQLVDTIRNDGIDILVDLAGHTGDNRMPVFALKPAPIQVSYIGYPNTTGLATIDYRFTDKFADPVGQSDPFYTETLVRLDPGFLCYQAPSDAPAVAPPPSERNGHVTFGSFNNISKITPETAALWARILHALPAARLVLKYHWLSDPPTREHYYKAFENHSISRERVEILGLAPTTAEHLAMYSHIDIALDPFPYNGTTTTCEALWMGVPVLTLAGHAHAGRVGVSLLSQVGLTELIAETQDQYLDKAILLAGDRDELRRLRADLRTRMAASTLCDAADLARRVESAYRTMWRRWCDERRRIADSRGLT